MPGLAGVGHLLPIVFVFFVLFAGWCRIRVGLWVWDSGDLLQRLDADVSLVFIV